MAVGGKGWQQIYTDHPEIFRLSSQGEQISLIYAAAIDAIEENPARIVGVYFQELFYYLAYVLRYLPYHNGLNIIYGFLLVIGMVTALIRFRQPVAGMMVLAVAGISLSAPFLIRDGGTRVFAATVPFMAVFAAMGLGVLSRALSAFRHPEINETASTTSSGVPNRLALGVALVMLVLFSAPVIAIGTYDRLRSGEVSCPTGEMSSVFTPGQSATSIRIHDDGDLPGTMVPDLRLKDFRKDSRFARIEIAEAFRSIKGPVTLMLIYDIRSPPRHQVWAIAEGVRAVPEGSVLVLACGQMLTEEQAGRSWPKVMRVNSFHRLDD